MFKSVANTISKLMSRVISGITITRAFGTRVIMFDITLLFICESYILINAITVTMRHHLNIT